MDDKEFLKTLEEQEKQAIEILSGIRGKIRLQKLKMWQNKTGISIGDKVSFLDGRVEKTGILESVDVNWSDGYPKIRLFKKDGTIGERFATAWNRNTLKKL